MRKLIAMAAGVLALACACPAATQEEARAAEVAEAGGDEEVWEDAEAL